MIPSLVRKRIVAPGIPRSSERQTIPRSAQLGLANGAAWTVRKKGTHLFSDWDWTLKVEAWGCVDNGYVP